jgi:hypothetical protein
VASVRWRTVVIYLRAAVRCENLGIRLGSPPHVSNDCRGSSASGRTPAGHHALEGGLRLCLTNPTILAHRVPPSPARWPRKNRTTRASKSW